MRLVLFDLLTPERMNFHPIAFSRPIWELRCGMTSLGEKLLARVKAMAPAERDEARQGQIIDVTAAVDATAARATTRERKVEPETGIKLDEARVIVAGGRGIGGAAGFQQLAELAARLGGAVGATRPPCDAKWAADSQQIGITGKIVSPDLYVAVAVSGASQHVSGCSSSKVIVAINKDPEANIFRVADYGIVDDWKAVVPALISALTCTL